MIHPTGGALNHRVGAAGAEDETGAVIAGVTWVSATAFGGAGAIGRKPETPGACVDSVAGGARGPKDTGGPRGGSVSGTATNLGNPRYFKRSMSVSWCSGSSSRGGCGPLEMGVTGGAGGGGGGGGRAMGGNGATMRGGRGC